MSNKTEEQTLRQQLSNKMYQNSYAFLNEDCRDAVDAALKVFAKQKENWEKEYQRREDESNLAMLTWLMDERSERMYQNSNGEAKLINSGWTCNTATMAVDTMKIETERRKLIAHLSSKEQKGSDR